jgi:transcriptional regulator of NAD metabolism
MTFDRENFLREMELFKKIPVLENEEFLHQKIIDESEKMKTDLDEISDSE